MPEDMFFAQFCNPITTYKVLVIGYLVFTPREINMYLLALGTNHIFETNTASLEVGTFKNSYLVKEHFCLDFLNIIKNLIRLFVTKWFEIKQNGFPEEEKNLQTPYKCTPYRYSL